MWRFFYKNRKWVLALSLILVMVGGTIGTVRAAEFPEGKTIPADETINDDVFISGDEVVIDGTVNGNLFATGETVTLNGTVVGDALLAGETIIVGESALVDGNLFIAGADLIVDGKVSGSVFGSSAALELGSAADLDRNFYYGGFSLTTDEGSQIGKDLFIGAYQALISGAVGRDMAVGAAAVELSGQVGRNAKIDVGEVGTLDEPTRWMQFTPYFREYVPETIQPGIRVSDEAEISGQLVYVSSEDQTAELESITSGQVTYQTPVPDDGTGNYQYRGPVREFDRGRLTGATLRQIAGNFIKLMSLGALALWLLRKPFMNLVDAATQEPLKAIGWGFVLIAVGFLAVIVVPLVFVMIGVILGFLSLGSLLYIWFGILGTAMVLAFMVFFFAVFTFSKVLAAFMFGRWLMKVIFKQEDNMWLSLLLGVFLYVLIRAIPVVGWLAGLAASLIGSGAFRLVFLQKKAAA